MIRRRDKIEALSVDIERGDFMEDRIYRGFEAKDYGSSTGLGHLRICAIATVL